MNLSDALSLGKDVSVAAVLLIWLWKGILPELRGMRAELRAIEKHLAAKGQRDTALALAVRQIFDSVEEHRREEQRAHDFMISRLQEINGRSTAPGESGPNGGA